jgi:hypothetical protein
VSKYRVEFKKSRFLVMIQLLSGAILTLTVVCWQPEIFKFEFLLQSLVVCLVLISFFKTPLIDYHRTHNPVIFSERGEWTETNIDDQISWKITDKSRVSIFLVFIHLVSPVNYRNSKWRLVYKDQVDERDYRRLCRAIIYQQQSNGKN